VVLAWDGNELRAQPGIAAGAATEYGLVADGTAYAVAPAVVVVAPAALVVVIPRKRAARTAARAVADLVKLDEVRMVQRFPNVG
jgi:hypothetical protein